MSASGAGGWLDPNLFWKPAPFFFPRYEAYVVWHYFGFNVDPHHAAPGDGLVGYGAEVKFCLDDPPIVIVRFHWTGGTVNLEEFTNESAETATRRVLYTDVDYAVDAQELVVTLLQDPAFWREQLDRYWGGTDPAMTVPSQDRLDIHAHAVRLMATDPAFLSKVVTNASGESPLIVMDWNDPIREFFAAIERVGLPSNLVVPSGESGIWLLNLLESQAHSKFTHPFDLDDPLGKLLTEVARRGRISVCPADRPAAIEMKFFREAS